MKNQNRKTEDPAAANLIFIGDRVGLEPIRTARLQGGRLIVRMPADQTQPMYCAYAREVTRTFPRHYKLFN